MQKNTTLESLKEGAHKDIILSFTASGFLTAHEGTELMKFCDEFAEKVYLAAIEDAKGAMPEEVGGDPSEPFNAGTKLGWNKYRAQALENLTKLADHRTPECRHHETQYCVLCDTKLVEK